MIPHSENAMARFLFAILKQKELKDIDWNRVAQDPVLKEPISNGHAARMRYSRFRATVQGHEPPTRPCRDDKGRVTKPKKPQPSRKAVVIKSESGPGLSAYAQFSPASASSPYEARDDFHARFLTPCSDDMSHVASIRPAAVERQGPSAGLAPSASTSPYLDHPSLSPAFHGVDAAYDMGTYRDDASVYEVGFPAGNHELGDLGDGHALIDCGQAWSDGGFQDAQLF